MTKRLSLFVAFFCLCILAQCSTGASTGSGQPGSIAGIQDGQDSVPVSQLFTITFVAPVDLSTVTSSSFFLVPADSSDASLSANASVWAGCNVENAIAASVACDSQTTCTLTPLAELEFNTTYSLCLTSSIHFANPQIAGVFAATQITFTTEEQSEHALGGSISGLEGTVTLQNNGEDFLEIAEDGAFIFDILYPSGTPYEVSVAEQPAIQTCSVANASGTVLGSDVTNVMVTCSVDTFLVGGTLSGLVGSVTLQNNGGDDLVLSGDGDFDFATAVADTSPYEVTVLTQPDTQTCSVSQGSGLMDGADITDVSVVCTVNIPPPTVEGVAPDSGFTNVNTEVTISGSNFTGATQVYFGASAADSFSVNSDSSITATSPLGTAGVVDITVVTPEGTSTTSSADQFTYIDPPAIIFVSNVSNGNLGGFSGADAKCNADSNKPSSGFAASYTYKALLNGNNATTSGVSYYRSNGTTIIATATGGNLVGANALINSISTVAINMWTGANGINNCTNWTSSSVAVSGNTGRAEASTSSYWNNAGATAVCSASTRAVYCVSQ